MQIEYKGNSLAEGERIRIPVYKRAEGWPVNETMINGIAHYSVPTAFEVRWFVHHEGILTMQEEDESA